MLTQGRADNGFTGAEEDVVVMSCSLTWAPWAGGDWDLGSGYRVHFNMLSGIETSAPGS